MLILGTFSLAITAVAVWSTIHGQNGFAEVVKMLQGQPAFIPNSPKVSSKGNPTDKSEPDTKPAPDRSGGWDDLADRYREDYTA
jgi:hypothetical protein